MTRLFLASGGSTAAASARLRFGAPLAGVVDSYASFITLSETSIRTDETLEVTVYLRDANGNAVAGKDVGLSVSPSGTNALPASVTTDGQGAAVFTITPASDVDETYTITATDTTDSIVVVQEPTFDTVAVGREVTIAGGTDVNVFTAAGSPTLRYNWLITVTADVTAMRLGTGWPAGSSWSLLNLARILGRGGAGGTSTWNSNGTAGSAGTDALDLDGKLVSIDNDAGYIFGGGGGGGGGSGPATRSIGTGYDVTLVAAGGGGGGGAGGAATSGGAAASNNANANVSPGSGSQSITNTVGNVTFGGVSADINALATAGSNGGSGGAGTGGTGADVSGDGGTAAVGGAGGAGGNFGEAGAAGSAGTGSGSTYATLYAGGAGGAAGKAINLDGGTANFVSGNTAERVKGAVS